MPGGELSADALAAVFEDFARLYEGFYGYRLDGIPIELVRLSVVATGEELRALATPWGGGDGDGATEASRPVFFPGARLSSRRRSSAASTLATETALRRPARRRGDGLDDRRAAATGRSRVLTDGMLELERGHESPRRHRSGHAHDPEQRLRERLPRDGHHDDADGVLADLQRGARLLVRALRPAREHDRPGRVLPGPARREPLHRALDGGGARRRVLRAGRRRPAQRPLPRRRPHPRALGDPARLLRGRAVRLRRQRRPPRRDRRQGGRQLRRRTRPRSSRRACAYRRSRSSSAIRTTWTSGG